MLCYLLRSLSSLGFFGLVVVFGVFSIEFMGFIEFGLGVQFLGLGDIQLGDKETFEFTDDMGSLCLYHMYIILLGRMLFGNWPDKNVSKMCHSLDGGV